MTTRLIPLKQDESYRLVGSVTGPRALLITTTLKPPAKRARRQRRVPYVPKGRGGRA